MHRYFLELAYNGAAFHGWQIQPNARSVQEVINDALGKALRQSINVVGAGRTDTGVHASYFVAHFDIDSAIDDTAHVVHRLNRILHNDVVVYSLIEVSPDAHTRFSALYRTYHYYITRTKNPFYTGLTHRIPTMPDVEAMNQACGKLFEYKDFTSFSKLHTDTKTNNCLIMEAEWNYHHDVLVFTVKADRFLRNMVRALVGTLLQVGAGKLTVNDFCKIIEAKDRGQAGVSAPPQALFLVDIGYDSQMFASQHEKRTPLGLVL